MVKAVVLGAAALVSSLKTNPAVTELALYDIVNAPGVAVDLSHIATPAKVQGYLPPNDGLKNALTGAQVVVVPAGVPRKPCDDLFKINAGIVRDLATAIATTAPKAFVLVISNPVNSTVPIVAEVFKQHNVFDPKRLFGVTTLDVVRASTFVAEVLGDLSLSQSITVPVIGGHSGVTIVPLLSQSSHPLPENLDKSTIDSLINRIQFGGDEVVKAKDGTGSATFLPTKIIRAFNGEKGIVVPSYVNLTQEGGEALKKELGKEIDLLLGTGRTRSFVADTFWVLQPNGIERINGLGAITPVERVLVDAALPELATSIEKGVSFIQTPKL
ncbi:malate dehydrogenase [Pisolithus microcarpus]|nr:malate dehydrogenase [Pisolithus microcarpus]